MAQPSKHIEMHTPIDLIFCVANVSHSVTAASQRRQADCSRHHLRPEGSWTSAPHQDCEVPPHGKKTAWNSTNGEKSVYCRASSQPLAGGVVIGQKVAGHLRQTGGSVTISSGTSAGRVQFKLEQHSTRPHHTQNPRPAGRSGMPAHLGS